MRGRKRWIILVLSLALCGICTGALAEYAVIDNTSSLNLRQGPGYDTKVLASYTKGEWVEIQQSFGDWDQVRVLRTGRTGYMVDGYLTRPGYAGEDVGIPGPARCAPKHVKNALRETGIRTISVWLYSGVTTPMKLDVQPIKK